MDVSKSINLSMKLKTLQLFFHCQFLLHYGHIQYTYFHLFPFFSNDHSPTKRAQINGLPFKYFIQLLNNYKHKLGKPLIVLATVGCGKHR